MKTHHCTDSERRRKLVTRINAQEALNGIEHLEIACPQADNGSDQQQLYLNFFASNGLQALADNHNQILIRGRRSRPIEVLDALQIGNKVVDLRVRGLRPSESYTLKLVKTEGSCRTDEPVDGFDPRYSETQFTWQLGPNTHVDPHSPAVPAAPLRQDADVDYLARDYPSLKRLILDRLSKTMPQWRERNPSDIGMTLVELLAWVGDRLAYKQDAVGTEAYLRTARQRISVRRHARLVDYRIHEGCNARALVQLQVEKDIVDLKLNRLRICTAPSAEFRSLAREHMEGRLIEHVPAHLEERFYDSVKVFEPIQNPQREVLLTTDDLVDVRAIIQQLGAIGAAVSVLDDVLGDEDSRSSAHRRTIVFPRLEAIWREMRPQTQDEIRALLPKLAKTGVNEHFQTRLIDEFNRLITEERLEKHPFDGQLSDGAMALAACHAEDADFRIHNRIFLDKAFPQALSSIGSATSLFAAHNEIRFYTWDEDECWLPAGATSATLLDPYAKGTRTTDGGADATQTIVTQTALNLSVGDILVFEERKGPKTGNEADANPDHRHAVRLTRVCKEVDRVPSPAVPVLEIEWSEDDALPFPICLSSKASAPECTAVPNVSIARGNILLVDHGRTVEEPTNTHGGPKSTDRFTVTGTVEKLDCGDQIRRPTRVMKSDRFRPWLSHANLTFAETLTTQATASKILQQDKHKALPSIELTGVPGALSGRSNGAQLARFVANTDDAEELFFDLENLRSLASLLPPEVAYWLSQQTPDNVPNPGPTNLLNLLVRCFERLLQFVTGDLTRDLKESVLGLLKQATRWEARYDLIDSASTDRHFAVELDNERRAFLRFGDGTLGLQPTVGSGFYAKYRVGNGQEGNIGAESLSWLISSHDQAKGIRSVRNPMAAQGGTDPQAIQEVKLLAPHAYRENQPRAITSEDYRRLVLFEFSAEIQGARASIEASATGMAAMVAIDPFDSVRDPDHLQLRVQQALHRFRSVGHQVHVTLAEYVPLDVALIIRVNKNWRRSLVRQSLSGLFSNRVLPGGQRGLFHPDNLTFGNDVHKSVLISQAQAVPGVDGVTITKLQRMGETPVLRSSDSLAIANDGVMHCPSSVSPDVLSIGPLEIARLDNNGSKSKGRLCLELEGGI